MAYNSGFPKTETILVYLRQLKFVVTYKTDKFDYTKDRYNLWLPKTDTILSYQRPIQFLVT